MSSSPDPQKIFAKVIKEKKERYHKSLEPAIKDHKDQKDQKDHKDHKELLDHKDHKDRLL